MTDAPQAPSPRRRGLGRGLEALLASVPSVGDPGPVLLHVDPRDVRPNVEQPRTHFDEESLAALADSIRRHGLLHPVVVEPLDGGHRLVAGERRLRAAQLAGVASIPALLRPATESGRHALELALTENLLRTDLTAIEEAAAFSRLADAFGLSHEAIAVRVGRSRPVVTNTIRLLALPAAVQTAVVERRISAGHARALLALPVPADREAMAERIEREQLSVRQTEAAVQRVLGTAHHPDDAPPDAPAPPAASAPPNPDDEALRRNLERVLGAEVMLERRRVGGRLVIRFASDADLHDLYTRLGGGSP